MMPELVPPDVRLRRSFVAAMGEDPSSRISGFSGTLDSLDQAQTFSGYVRMLLADARPESPIAADLVHYTMLWWVEGEEFIGRVSVRHRLTPELLAVGGHIGYWIRPSQRGHGHATAAFQASLPVAAALGIDPALLTCDHDHDVSRRIIESAGGVFDNRIGAKLRYWVPTTSRPAGPR
jgi:predicted acetyltransferase